MDDSFDRWSQTSQRMVCILNTLCFKLNVRGSVLNASRLKFVKLRSISKNLFINGLSKIFIVLILTYSNVAVFSLILSNFSEC